LNGARSEGREEERQVLIEKMRRKGYSEKEIQELMGD